MNLESALLDSPELPEIVCRLQRMIDAERQRRRRFLEELNPTMKAEFINGEMVLHSTAKSRHINASDNAFCLIRTFAMHGKAGRAMHEKALVSFPRNDYEPDVAFFLTPRAALIESDQMRMPVPDLAVEVLSDSTAERDRGVKFADYAIHGVREYWIIDPEAETLEIFSLPEGSKCYPPTPVLGKSDTAGSSLLPGLTFPVAALFEEEAQARALAQLGQIQE